MYELKQGPEAAKIVLQATRLRKPLPPSITNAPVLFPWLHLFYVAFNDLTTERRYVLGQIPWSAKQKWAECHQLDDIATMLLHRHTEAMDAAYLKYCRDKIAADRAKPPS